MKSKFKEVGEMLRKKRKERGLTQSELANVLGYSNAQFVSNIERGLANIPVSKIRKLSKVLRSSETELYSVVCSANMPFRGPAILVIDNQGSLLIRGSEEMTTMVRREYMKIADSAAV